MPHKLAWISSASGPFSWAQATHNNPPTLVAFSRGRPVTYVGDPSPATVRGDHGHRGARSFMAGDLEFKVRRLVPESSCFW